MPGGGGGSSSRSASARLGDARDRPDHGRVTEVQRARLLAAMTRAAGERGAARVTVADVVAGAAVSRRTFYEIFDNCHDCLLAALEDATARAAERVPPAWRQAGGGWRGRVRAALAALLALFDQQPELARLLVVEWPGSGAEALERRRRVLERIAEAVDEGRMETRGRPETPPLAAEGAVGAILAILHARLVSSGRTDAPPIDALIELTSTLTSMVVLPYLGPAAARRELARPAPQAGSAPGPAPEEPSEDVRIRVTYRTMRVLAAIASSPGASNSAVARAAGVGDQGQISKLLRRLRGLGLIESSNPNGAVRGLPNAWSLTASGERVERSLRP